MPNPGAQTPAPLTPQALRGYCVYVDTGLRDQPCGACVNCRAADLWEASEIARRAAEQEIERIEKVAFEAGYSAADRDETLDLCGFETKGLSTRFEEYKAGGTPMTDQPKHSVTRTKTYAVCPSCGEDAGWIDHLLEKKTRTSGYCDSCGHRYALDFDGRGGVVVSAAPGRKITTKALLVLEPQQKPVYFVVDGMRFEDEPGMSPQTHEEQQDSSRFYYEEHSCPTNWFQPKMVYFDGDTDPHGLIQFVATRDSASFPPDEDCGPNPHDEALVEFIEQHAKGKSHG